MTTDRMADTFARIDRLAAALNLPGATVGTSYGTSALKVGGRGFVRMKDAETLVLMCPLEQKEMLLAAAPYIYFETDHYRGWPAVLVHLDAISDAELTMRLKDAWREKAPAKLRSLRPRDAG